VLRFPDTAAAGHDNQLRLKKPGPVTTVQQVDEEPLGEQLREIAHAFNRFKQV
jgi:hypothetical protein